MDDIKAVEISELNNVGAEAFQKACTFRPSIVWNWEETT